MTVTTVMPAEDAVVEISWLWLLKQSRAGEDGDECVNGCVCEAYQPRSQVAQQQHQQHTVDHQVLPMHTAVAAVGQWKY